MTYRIISVINTNRTRSLRVYMAYKGMIETLQSKQTNKYIIKCTRCYKKLRAINTKEGYQ